jgi:glycosyltransferase involved in cell wall biosynthesis
MKQIKKILFLTDNFPPETNAPASRTYEHAREWVKMGFQVTIITCAPNFPTGKVFSGYSNKLISKEVIDGIIVIRVWSYISANEGFLKRVIDYISFAVMAFFVGLFVRTDIIIATSPQFFTAIAGRCLSFFKNRPWIMEVRDLWPESIVAVGAIKKKGFYKFLEWLEYGLYKSAKKIIVVTNSFKEIIAGNGVDPDKIFVHKNGVILDHYSPRDKDVYLLKANPILNQKIIFAYIGTHGMAHGLSFIVHSLPKIQDEIPGAHFLFIGDGAEKANLLSSSEKLGLRNITFLSSVPKQDIVRYLSLMDVALVNLKKSNTFKTVIPSKIFEAAALHKPILLGLEGETKDLIESFDAGICFEPENEEDFISKCNEIIKESVYKKLQNGCSQLAKAYDRRQIAKEVLNTIVSG